MELLHEWFFAASSRGVRAANILGTVKAEKLETEIDLDCRVGLGDQPMSRWADWEQQHLEQGLAAGYKVLLIKPHEFNRARYPTAQYARKLLPNFDLEDAFARLNTWVERLRSMPATA